MVVLKFQRIAKRNLMAPYVKTVVLPRNKPERKHHVTVKTEPNDQCNISNVPFKFFNHTNNHHFQKYLKLHSASFQILQLGGLLINQNNPNKQNYTQMSAFIPLSGR